jgi:hypothetical protein
MAVTRAVALTALLFCCAGPVMAQTVSLEFHDGKVSLTAQNAQLRTILTEWVRLGGTQVVNAERLTGAPLTMQLTDVPETQALDIILRGAAGYIAGERASAAPATGRSTLDRIMVVPTAGTAPVVASRASATPPPVQQTFPAYVQPEPDDNDVRPAGARAERVARPGEPAVVRAVPPNGQAAPSQPYVFEPDTQQAPAPTSTSAPANPFGVTTGSARPGMPAPPQPQRPPATRDQEP